MTEKQKSFVSNLKVVCILLAICLICGALLALCNDLLYVDDQTRFNRKIGKVYKNFVKDTEYKHQLIKESSSIAGVGSIKEVHRSTDGVFVLEAIGEGGFKNGTVTMLVAIGGGNGDTKIKGLTVISNVEQSYLDKVTQKKLDEYYVGKDIVNIESATFGAGYTFTGATGTSPAVFNCVKMVASYAINGLRLVSTPQSEALDAVKDLLADNDLTDYTITAVADSDYIQAVGADFYFVGSKANADSLEIYVYGTTDADRQIVVLKAGLFHADRLLDSSVLAKTEGISTELVAQAQSLSQLENNVRKYHENFTYDADGDLTSNTTHADWADTQITQVYKCNDGAMLIVAESNPTVATSEGNKNYGTLTVGVVVAQGKVVNWYLINMGGHNLFGDKLDLASGRPYVNVSVDDTISMYGATRATVSSTALYRIVNLSAYYAKNSAVAE